MGWVMRESGCKLWFICLRQGYNATCKYVYIVKQSNYIINNFFEEGVTRHPLHQPSTVAHHIRTVRGCSALRQFWHRCHVSNRRFVWHRTARPLWEFSELIKVDFAQKPHLCIRWFGIHKCGFLLLTAFSQLFPKTPKAGCSILDCFTFVHYII